jgi:hypothetical protein
MYLHIQRSINEIEADEPDTAAANGVAGGVGWSCAGPGTAPLNPSPSL